MVSFFSEDSFLEGGFLYVGTTGHLHSLLLIFWKIRPLKSSSSTSQWYLQNGWMAKSPSTTVILWNAWFHLIAITCPQQWHVTQVWDTQLHSVLGTAQVLGQRWKGISEQLDRGIPFPSLHRAQGLHLAMGMQTHTQSTCLLLFSPGNIGWS